MVKPRRISTWIDEVQSFFMTSASMISMILSKTSKSNGEFITISMLVANVQNAQSLLRLLVLHSPSFQYHLHKMEVTTFIDIDRCLHSHLLCVKFER